MMIILLRTVFLYFFILLMLRIMGKREIGKLSVFDLVIFIMIAEIAVIAIESTEESIWKAILPICLMVAVQIIFAFIAMKSRKVRLFLDGKPSVLIQNGQINRKEMHKQRYNLDDLMLQLREKQVLDLTEVQLAVLELSGKLSVITKKDDPTGSADATKVSPYFKFSLVPIILVIEGELYEDNLKHLGKTTDWLNKQFKSHAVGDIHEVYFCSVDCNQKLYLVKK